MHLNTSTTTYNYSKLSGALCTLQLARIDDCVIAIVEVEAVEARNETILANEKQSNRLSIY